MLEPWLLNTVWISLAFLGGLLAKRISLPPLIGFLAAGFMLNAFDITEGSQAMEVASSIGIMLLLFTIGLKLNIKDLFAKVIWMGTSLHMLIITILSGGFVFLISVSGLNLFTEVSFQTSLLIGFALSFSSTVFAIKILEGRGEVNSFHGKVAIGILIMHFTGFFARRNMEWIVLASPVAIFAVIILDFMKII